MCVLLISNSNFNVYFLLWPLLELKLSTENIVVISKRLCNATAVLRSNIMLYLIKNIT